MEIKKTTPNDIENLMEIRLEMLRVVNNLKDSAGRPSEEGR